jgi:hypothetical protein
MVAQRRPIKELADQLGHRNIDEEEYLATRIRLFDSLQRCLLSDGAGTVQP